MQEEDTDRMEMHDKISMANEWERQRCVLQAILCVSILCVSKKHVHYLYIV